MPSKIVLLLVLSIGLVTGPVLADPTTWDYVADFSSTTNPIGPWSYGWLNPDYTVFTASTIPVITDYVGADYAFWADESVSNASPGVVLGTVAMDYPGGPGYGAAYVPPGGYLNSPANSAKPTVRWTSPLTARIRLTAVFKGTDWSNGSNTNVRIIKNGDRPNALLAATIQGFPGGGSHPAIGTAHTATYSADLDVITGDTIDFAASCPSSRTIRENVTLSANIEVIDLRDPVTVTGTVTDQASGSPIQNATVKALGTAVEAFTNAQGIYTLQLTPGTYTLEVSAALYAPQSAVVIVTDSGATNNFSLTKVTQWSLAGDWSNSLNPSGAWTYGRYSTGLTTFQAHTVPLDYYGVDLWRCTDEQYSLTMGSPGADADLDGILYPRGTVTFIPGQGAERSGARWTAPYAATLRVTAIWSGRYYAGPTSSDVRVLKNACTGIASTLYQGSIAGFAGGGGHPATGINSTAIWSGTVTVAKGDTVDFIAGIPSGGTRVGATAGIDATIMAAGSEVTVSRLADLKAAQPGQFVTFTQPVAVSVPTGTFTNGYGFVQDEDRLLAMKIILNAGIPATISGERIVIEGVLGSDSNGDRTIYVTSILSREQGEPVRPLGTDNKTIQKPAP